VIEAVEQAAQAALDCDRAKRDAVFIGEKQGWRVDAQFVQALAQTRTALVTRAVAPEQTDERIARGGVWWVEREPCNERAGFATARSGVVVVTTGQREAFAHPQMPDPVFDHARYRDPASYGDVPARSV